MSGDRAYSQATRELLGRLSDNAARPFDEARTLPPPLTRVNAEDKPTVEALYSSLRSDHSQQGPMSYLERNVYEFDRYLARRLCL